MSDEALHEARHRYAQRAWREAYARYQAAAATVALDLDDLEHFGIAAHLLGHSEECREIFAQGYREALRIGLDVRAARFAFLIGHRLMFEGRMSEMAGWEPQASGWPTLVHQK